MDLAFGPADGDESTALFVAGLALGAMLRAHAGALGAFVTSWKPTHAPFGSV